MSTEEGKSIYDGILYTVDERLETFEGSHWPFEDGKCTPLKMAEAGFYYCGTTSNPDWVRCIVCHIDMDGWEETDNPWEEHKKNSNCPFIKKIRDPYQITYGEVVELEKEAVKLYIVRY
jgi:baculoviral IAP repeat-containing protein 5